ncbi:hypothetical protein ANANG_G00040080 [Anguilla anguilla]|uniref:RNA-binding protein Luc7-like 1 n=1 Tax=Anguilla anguilla TaxID=7936 RepID=A0A9D3S994_ANGAN|nr:hypothetical protein ANANG_G00040080 [Anguilla anguilla]
MDLGECSKIHDLALRADYEIASKERDLFFELDAVDHLESFIADCDRRTELAKKRLAETQEEISAEVAAKAEKVHELNEEIGKLLAKSEQLGAEGNVDEAQKVLQEVEKVRSRKRDAEEEYRNSMPASSFQQQKLRVCEVCSAYLGLHDNDRRLADHFGGKLHLGFIQIREKLEQLKKMVAEKQERRNQERLKRREEREREERMRKRGDSALTDTSAELHRGTASGTRSQSREHRRSRSRERRRRRSRSASRRSGAPGSGPASGPGTGSDGGAIAAAPAARATGTAETAAASAAETAAPNTSHRGTGSAPPGTGRGTRTGRRARQSGGRTG